MTDYGIIGNAIAIRNKRPQKERHIFSRLCFIAGAAGMHDVGPDDAIDDEQRIRQLQARAMLMQMLGENLQRQHNQQRQRSRRRHRQRRLRCESQPGCSPAAIQADDAAAALVGTVVGGGGPQCPHCSRVYSNASNLRQHVRNVHMPVDESLWHTCPTCAKRLKTKHYLINHQLQAHGIHQRGGGGQS